MHNRKFISLLQAIDTPTLNQFMKYVASPYFNSNKRALTLMEVLKKYHPEYNSPALKIERVYKKVFGNKAFREQAVKNLLTELTRLFESFLTQQHFDTDTNYQEEAFWETIIKQNMNELFDKKLEHILERQAQKKRKDAPQYHHQFRLLELDYTWQIAQRSRLKQTKLLPMINQLDQYYIAHKLKYYCVMHNRQRMVTGRFQMPLLDSLLEHLQTEPYSDIPLISFWHKLLLFMTSENSQKEANYSDLKKLLEEKGTTIPIEDARAIYVAVINYCARKTRTGEQKYWEELFQHYERMLQQDLLLEKGYLTPAGHFSNIPAIALRLGKIKWVEQFIKEYKDKIPPKEQKSLVSYVSALLAYHKKDYWDAVFLLKDFEIQGVPTQYVSCKFLLVKAYFELEEFELMEAVINAISIYIRRNEQIPPAPKKAYQNFILMANKMSKAWQNNAHLRDKTALQKKKKDLLEELNNIGAVTQKEWLLQKLKVEE